jgi:hypothetical protein
MASAMAAGIIAVADALAFPSTFALPPAGIRLRRENRRAQVLHPAQNLILRYEIGDVMNGHDESGG